MAGRRGGLTARQEAFVREYLIDLNATQAAIRAGYSERTARQAGSENLSKPAIAAAIQAGQSARRERTETDADRVVRELKRLAFSDLRQLVDWSGLTVTLKDSKVLPDDAAAAVSEVSLTQAGVKIKLHSKPAAIDKLMRHLGLYKERPPLEVLLAALPADLGDAVRRELGRLLAGGGGAPGGGPAHAPDGPG